MPQETPKELASSEKYAPHYSFWKAWSELTQKVWVGYAFAVFGSMLATLLRWLLGTWFGPEVPLYIIFYGVVMFSALFGGVGPGILATILSAFGVIFFFIPPINQLRLDDPGELVGVLLFASVSVVTILVCASLRAVRSRALASERRLLATFDNAAMGLIEVDKENRIVEVNLRACQMLGYARHELLGMTIDEITHPEDREASGRLNRELGEGLHARLEYEKRYVKRDGTSLWVHVAVSPLRDSQGHNVGAMGTFEDISERKATQLRVLSEKALSDATVNSLPGIFLLFDSEKRILRYNENTARSTGYSQTEIKEMQSLDFVIPEERAKMAGLLGQVLKDGEGSAELCVLAKDGRRFPYNFTARRFQFDGMVGLVAVGLDITERLKAEAALTESEQRFRLFMDNSPTLAWVKDEQGRYVYLNRVYEQRFGIKLADAKGKTDDQLWPPQVAARLQAADQQVLAGEGPITVTEETTEADQTHSTWLNTKFIFRDSDGIRFIASIGLDISDRKRSEVELERERAFIEAVFQACPAGIIVADPGGTLVRMNPANARLWGLAPFSKSVDEYRDWKGWWADEKEHHGRRLEPGEWALARSLRGEVCPGDIVEIEPFGAPGTRKIMLNSGAPVRGSAGEILGAVIVQVDITDRRRAEAAVQKQAQLIELSPTATIVRSPEGNITFWSAGAQTLYGWAPEEALGRKTHDLLHTHFSKPFDEILSELRKGGKWSGELRQHTKEGRIVFVETHWLGQFDASGQLVELMESNMDITERKRSAELLGLQLAALQAADNAIIFTDARASIQWVNAAFTRLTGYTSSEAKGMNPRILKSGNHEPAFYKEMWKTLLAGKVWHGEMINKRKDGSIYYEEMTITPVKNAKQELTGYVAIKQDITPRKQAEEALRRSERRLRVFFDSDMVGTIFWTMDGRVTDANDKFLRMVGYDREDLLSGRVDWTKMTPPEYRPLDEYALEELRSKGTDTPYEKEYIRRDGTRIPIIIGAAMLDEKRNEGVAFALDITERKHTEQALRRSEERFRALAAKLELKVQERTAKLRETVEDLEHFSYSIIHDMRAPLRAMQSFSSMLEQECVGCVRPQARDYFRRIEAAAWRLDKLIQDSLDYTKVLREELPLTSVDLGSLLRGLVESYPSFQPHAHQIHIEFDRLMVEGNVAGLTQCFSNLIGNALKFVAPGVQPDVRIWSEEKFRNQSNGWASENETAPAQEIVRIWIEDNGLGIPEEAREKIFHMFQRLHTDREYTGTGIGLAIVSKAVQRMGGQVGVESGPAGGSRFWLELEKSSEKMSEKVNR